MRNSFFFFLIFGAVLEIDVNRIRNQNWWEWSAVMLSNFCSVHANFLLLMWWFSENSTQFDSKSLHLVASFDDFMQINNVLTQENHTFIQYQLQEKFIFLIVSKIVFVQKWGGDFKVWTPRKVHILTISCQVCRFLPK